MAIVSEDQRSGFFNYILDEENEPDRAYDAIDFSTYFSLFIGNGVFIDPVNQLRVDYTGGNEAPFAITVRKGWAFIEGYYYQLVEDVTANIPVNGSATDIVDSIVCVLDRAKRLVYLDILENVGIGKPRNNGVVHDLVLATITVRANSSKITQNDIVDRRPDPEYCGFVKSPLETLDLSEMFSQYYDAFERFGNDFQEEQQQYFNQQQTIFNNWMQTIQNQLSEDAATDLQGQINQIKYYYVSNKTLYLPNTNTSVSEHILFIGSGTQGGS